MHRQPMATVARIAERDRLGFTLAGTLEDLNGDEVKARAICCASAPRVGSRGFEVKPRLEGDPPAVLPLELVLRGEGRNTLLERVPETSSLGPVLGPAVRPRCE